MDEMVETQPLQLQTDKQMVVVVVVVVEVDELFIYWLLHLLELDK